MNEKKYAVMMMLISSSAFAFMGLFVKLTPGIMATQKAIFRTATVMVISYIILKKKYKKIPKVKNLKWLLFRSIFGSIGIVLNYYALEHLLLSDASIIFRLSTILVLLLSYFILKESLSKKHVIPILTGFLGLFFVIRPSFNSSLFDYIIALLGVGSASLAYMSLRILGKTEDSNMVVFFFSAFSSLVLIPFLIYDFKPMTIKELLFLILAGVFATIGQYGITLAYKYAPAKEVSIYNYIGVVFSGILEFIIFATAPDMISIFGYVVIFASSYMLYRITIKEVWVYALHISKTFRLPRVAQGYTLVRSFDYKMLTHFSAQDDSSWQLVSLFDYAQDDVLGAMDDGLVAQYDV